MIYYINLKLIQYYNKTIGYFYPLLRFFFFCCLSSSFSYHSVIKFIIVRLTQNFDHISLPKCDLVGKFQLYFIANSLNNVIITIHITIEI